MIPTLTRFETIAKDVAFWRIPLKRLSLPFKWGAYFMPNTQVFQKATSIIKSGAGLFHVPVFITNAFRLKRYVVKLRTSEYPDTTTIFRKTVTKCGDLIEKGCDSVVWTDGLFFNALAPARVLSLASIAAIASFLSASTRLIVSSCRLYQGAVEGNLEAKTVLRFTRDICIFALAVGTMGMVMKGQAESAFLLLFVQTVFTFSEYIRFKLREHAHAQ